MDHSVASDTSISKININGQNVYCRILWEDNENDLFRLKIFAGSSSWSGRFSTEFAENCRSLLDETKEEYKMNARKAFSDSNDDFVYDFVISADDENAARFSWKKVFEDSTIMAHGSIPLHRDDAMESKDALIDLLLSENKDLRETIEVLDMRNNALTENLEKCKKEMEEFVHMKTQLESSLYGKFVQLLNEKKRRIRLLEENIQKFE